MERLSDRAAVLHVLRQNRLTSWATTIAVKYTAEELVIADEFINRLAFEVGALPAAFTHSRTGIVSILNAMWAALQQMINAAIAATAAIPTSSATPSIAT